MVLAGTSAVLVAATIAVTVTVTILGPNPTPAPINSAANATGFTTETLGSTSAYPGAPTPTSVDTPPAGSAPTGRDDAGAELEGAVAADQNDVAVLADAWVPQLSSKQVGTVADGFAYTNADILADYQRNRANYPQARLIRSSDWTVFSSHGYYVTIVDIPYPSADQANAWCDSHYLAATDCYAKKLSHTAGPGAATKHRG